VPAAAPPPAAQRRAAAAAAPSEGASQARQQQQQPPQAAPKQPLQVPAVSVAPCKPQLTEFGQEVRVGSCRVGTLLLSCCGNVPRRLTECVSQHLPTAAGG
jgi:hypothetical protein